MNFTNGMKKTMIKDCGKKQKDMTATPLKYPQKYFKDKPCKWCSKIFPPNGPSHYYCSEDCKSKAHSDKYYKRNYGLGLQEFFQIMEEQGWKCAICKTFGFKMRDNHISGLNCDHDHVTGKVRGLLCHNCNRGLGLFQDNVEYLTSAVKYLEKSRDV